jgi:Zn finger protein HypA/HybF involved in hydrogenase expression
LSAAWPDNFTVDLDQARFGDIDPPSAYAFHGIEVIQRGGIVELYVVNHAPEHGEGGGRESVEVFEIDLPASGPALRWRGAVPGPAWLGGNDLCCLPEGGFAITNFCYPGPEAMQMGWGAVIGGTKCEGAKLVLDLLKWQMACDQCGRKWESEDVYVECSCGCATPHPVGGDELDLMSMDVEVG